jgi:hypothetical protein
LFNAIVLENMAGLTVAKPQGLDYYRSLLSGVLSFVKQGFRRFG